MGGGGTGDEALFGRVSIRMKRILLALLLAFPLVSSAGTEALTLALPVSDRSIGATGHWAREPVLAVNAGVFVAVRLDGSNIVVSRLEPSGAVVQTARLEWAGALSLRSVVRAGDGFLVVVTVSDGHSEVLWMNDRGEFEGAPRQVLGGYLAVAASTGARVIVFNEYDEAVLLSASGQILRSDIRLPASDGSTRVAFSAAASRNRFVRVSATYDQVVATTVGLDGAVLRTSVVSPDSNLWDGLRAASDGDELVVAWRTDAAIEMTSVDRPATRMTIPLPHWYGMDMAWNGSDYVLVVADAQTRVRRMHVDRDLTSVLTNEVLVDDDSWEHGETRLAVEGAQTLAIWSTMARCSGSSSPADQGVPQIFFSWTGRPPQRLTSGTADDIEPVVAAGAGPPLVLWNEMRDRARQRAALVEPVPRLLPLPPEPMVNQAVATDGSGYLAATVAVGEDCALNLKVTAFDAAGSVLSRWTAGPAGDSWVFPRSVFTPSVGWNGSEYLVAWAVGSTILGVRVSPAGVPIDLAPVTLVISPEPGTLTPRVVWGANGWVVVWLRSRMSSAPLGAWPPSVNVISFQTVDRDLLPQRSALIAQYGWSPAVATDGARVLIAWRDYGALHAATLEPDGTLKPAGEVPRRGEYAQSLSAAFAGRRFHVLDLNRLYAVGDGAMTLAAELPPEVVTTNVAGDGTRLIIIWSAPDGDGTHRIHSSFFFVEPEAIRRRSVRSP